MVVEFIHIWGRSQIAKEENGSKESAHFSPAQLILYNSSTCMFVLVGRYTYCKRDQREKRGRFLHPSSVLYIPYGSRSSRRLGQDWQDWQDWQYSTVKDRWSFPATATMLPFLLFLHILCKRINQNRIIKKHTLSQ
jgi:hypothetical protein